MVTASWKPALRWGRLQCGFEVRLRQWIMTAGDTPQSSGRALGLGVTERRTPPARPGTV